MSKGTRREQEACEIWENAGFLTYRPATVRFGENDIFGHFDLIAMRSDRQPHYVQVKSNGARGITQWCKDVREYFPFDCGRVFFAVPYDRSGWRLIEVTEDSRTDVVDERDVDCNMGSEVVNYLSAPWG